jgi:hypothetical protein
MLHIRHPFDVLVSMFDAWTSTATTEFNKSLAGKSQADRDEQARRRDELRAEGVDAYVLSRMNQVRLVSPGSEATAPALAMAHPNGPRKRGACGG